MNLCWQPNYPRILIIIILFNYIHISLSLLIYYSFIIDDKKNQYLLIYNNIFFYILRNIVSAIQITGDWDSKPKFLDI